MLRQTKARWAAVALIRQALILVFLSLAIFVVVVTVALPRVLGAEGITVLTNSMEPKYPAGTFLIVEPASANSLEVGEIITYQLKSGQPDLVTHRIIGFGTTEAGDTTFLTQGDNNSLADEEAVLPVQVRGELLYAVPWVGYIATLAGRSRDGLVPWIAAGLLLYGAVTFSQGIIARRRSKAAAGSGAPAAVRAASDESAARQPMGTDPAAEVGRSFPPHTASRNVPARSHSRAARRRQFGRHSKKARLIRRIGVRL